MIQHAQHIPNWLEESLESPVAILGGCQWYWSEVAN